MSRQRRLSALVLVPVSVAVMTACGSTVRLQSTGQTASVDAGLGAVVQAPTTVITTDPGAPAAASDTAAAQAPTTSDVGAPAVVAPVTGGTTAAAPTGASRTTAAGKAATKTTAAAKTTTAAKGPTSGRGFTASTISLGFAGLSGGEGLVSSFAIKGLAGGDTNAQIAAVLGDLNSHGGILGRKAVAVIHTYDATEVVTNPAQANQEACADWTQDHQVFAVVVPAVVEDTLLSCLKATGTALINASGLNFPVMYSPTFQQYPTYFDIGDAVGELYDQISIGRLNARGYYSPWNTATGAPGTAAANPVKVGLIVSDDHNGDLRTASVSAQLAKIKVPLVDTIRCQQALTQLIACQQSAVLKFRSDGVTQAMGATLPFMQNASQQGYHPRYFFANEPRVFAANAPSGQMEGAMGEGTVPLLDVDTDKYPGDPTPATAACRNVMKAAGQDTSDPTIFWNMEQLCDGVNLTKAAVVKSGVLSADGFRAGLEALGSSAQASLTWTTRLGPLPFGHTTAVALRDLAWTSDCSCFAYTSSTNWTS